MKINVKMLILALVVPIVTGTAAFLALGGPAWLQTAAIAPEASAAQALVGVLTALVNGGLFFLAMVPWVVYHLVAHYMLRPKFEAVKVRLGEFEYANGLLEVDLQHLADEIQHEKDILERLHPVRQEAREMHERRARIS